MNILKEDDKEQFIRYLKETEFLLKIIKKGIPQSEESKLKDSIANSGENNPFYGKHHTEESKQKNRNAHLGKKDSIETRYKKSESNKIAQGVISEKWTLYKLTTDYINNPITWNEFRKTYKDRI